MSDPVTNVEIEDVLSSIRRLVSDGDKARTRDSAPVEAADETAVEDVQPVENTPESAPVAASTDRLVLTPAFLVVDGDNDLRHQQPEHTEENAEHTAEDASDEEWQEEDWPGHSEGDAPDDVSEDPLPLTEMVFEDVDEPAGEPETTDRSGLVATIAELEAAISAGEDDYEPDGSEAMSETIAWPGASARGMDAVEDADVSEDTSDAAAPDEEDVTATFEHRGPDEAQPSVEAADETADEYGDDDLDGLLEAGGATLDEDALRALVSEVVREELTGPLGERITRNVRKLVRREIYRILSSQEFD